MKICRVIALLIIVLMLGQCFCLAPVMSAEQFAGGSGTAEDPYQVATAEHLSNVREYLDANFQQTADIDLGTAPWNIAPGWVPIGSYDSGDRFTGSYDGGGFTIRNLTIDRGGDWSNVPRYQGLFSYKVA